MSIKHEQGACFVKCHAGESCGEYDIGVTPDALQRLRELRLWHWQMVLELRQDASSKRDFAVKYPFYSKDYNDHAAIIDADANEHLKFVQTLNDFFPDPHDTAEADAALEARAAAADKAGK